MDTTLTTATAISLSARLAALRESKNPSPKSTDSSSTSLATFLSIYNKSRGECYINYMEGAKALYHWLSPIDIPTDTMPLAKLPDFLITYEINQLAALLVPTPDSYTEETFYENLRERKRVRSLMLYLTLKEVFSNEDNTK